MSPRIATRTDDIELAARLGEEITDLQVSVWELGARRAIVILRLHEEHGMTTLQIAAAIGITQARVVNRIQYARKLREEDDAD